MGKVVIIAFALIILLLTVGALFAGVLISGGGGERPSDLAFVTGTSPNQCTELANANSVTSQQIEQYLTKKDAYKALEGLPADETRFDATGAQIAQAASEFSINPALMIGIFNAESSFVRNRAAHITRKARNPGNVKIVNPDELEEARSKGVQLTGEVEGHTKFPSWAEGFRGLGLKLRINYFNKGRITVSAIAEIYLTGDADRWAQTVTKTMNEVLAPCLQTFGIAHLPADKGICEFCIAKALPITAEMNQSYDVPRVIILHYLALQGDRDILNVDEAWQYFKNISSDGNSNNNKYVQFVIARDGKIYQFLPETKQAAGAEHYNTVPDGGISISIENEGHFEHSNVAFHETDAQIEANVKLVKYLMGKYHIAKEDVIGHGDADRRAIAAGRRTDVHRSDPGERFMRKVLSKL